MLNWRVIVAGVMLLCFLSPYSAWAEMDGPMQSLPLAKQEGVIEQSLDQILGVALIPVDIVLALIYAPGETKMKGNAYKGEYARHGFYRTHARWWDPFAYRHEF